MTLHITSTSLRFKYLQTLIVNSVFIKPKNGQKYHVVERNLTNHLVKAATHYLCNDIEPITHEIIPRYMLKSDNPIKVDPNKLLKSNIQFLDENTLIKSHHHTVTDAQINVDRMAHHVFSDSDVLEILMFSISSVPDSTYFVSASNSLGFYGSLSGHPGCSMAIDVNSALKTSIKQIFCGTNHEQTDLAGKVIEQRYNKRIASYDEFESLVSQWGGKLDESARARIKF
ncbi:hypothetical protein BDEG_23195 [Batrachochytrium dendrobatidis JEL423]|nr:hypothetical protein BDEG_23195 [Batrachochytrium dendrobatidis JEL423]